MLQMLHWTKKPTDKSGSTLQPTGMLLSARTMFGDWFHPGDHCYHQVQVERIEIAIHPREICRKGTSRHRTHKAFLIQTDA